WAGAIENGPPTPRRGRRPREAKRRRGARRRRAPRRAGAVPVPANGQPAPGPERATPPAPGGRMVPPARGVKVRMYRTGLGDCFLLAFPRSASASDGRPDGFYLLVDCGVYKGTPEPDNATRIKQVVQDIREATGGSLDVLVITHEHWDHVSAFHESQAQALLAQIPRGTLWLAWTENLDIKLAKDLHDGRKAARAALASVLSRMQGLTDDCGTADLVRKVLDF